MPSRATANESSVTSVALMLMDPLPHDYRDIWDDRAPCLIRHKTRGILGGMTKRTSAVSLDAAALDAAAQMFDVVGLSFDRSTNMLTGGAESLQVMIMGASTITAPVDRFASRRHRPVLVVGDLITAEARTDLDQAGVGWLDRRGHAKFVVPRNIHIDTDLDAMPRKAGVAGVDRSPIAGAAGLAVAVDALVSTAHGAPPGRVTRIAEVAGIGHSSTSRAAKRLRDAVLLTDRGAVCPELFWATVEVWEPRWVDLTSIPTGASADGLLLTSTWQAISHGAQLVVPDAWPIELYAPDDRTVARVVATQDLDAGPAVARIAVAPTPVVFAGPAGGRFSFDGVDPVVAALDLAMDPGRGSESLRDWVPNKMKAVW